MSGSAIAKACAGAAGVWCGAGLSVPLAPTGVAVAAVVLVRILVWTKTQSITWNFAVCGLAMLAAFATIEGTSLTVFAAFWLGVGYGAIGVGIIEIGKNATMGGLKERLQAAGRVLFGIKEG